MLAHVRSFLSPLLLLCSEFQVVVPGSLLEVDHIHAIVLAELSIGGFLNIDHCLLFRLLLIQISKCESLCFHISENSRSRREGNGCVARRTDSSSI